VIDLRNSDRYSPGKIHRAFEGADVSRFPFKASNDNNGNSFLTRGNRYADYINFQFELLSEYNGNDTVYVVGDFNGWMPSKESQMMYDPVTSRYIHSVSLRRGQYDYQYVLNGNDWIAYEGNDWRTINLYTAVVYYHDFRKGGYDRVLKVVQRYSQSTQEPTAD
jgi:hypothetical protein